ncbi:MAG TPA: hypothetical protein VGV89_09095 [Thermoplasmata archaeon]|nr:hypothetical protein [Thermoplasmata archaeon]
METADASVGRDRDALDWLLGSSQPSVRHYSLKELVGRGPNDPEVRRARALIPKRGWASELLATQKPGGYWEAHEPKTVREWVSFLRFPVFGSSMWKGMVLADLGLTSEDRRIRRFAERMFEHTLHLSTPLNLFTEEVCIVGNAATMMSRFGCVEDRRVRKLYDWMIEDQREDGGWNCAADKPGTLDSWEAMAAFAAVPEAKRSPAMERAVARGAEFFLERRLFEEGRRYAPWFRFHYPTHYYYDVLVGLDVLTRLGYAGDPRLRPTLKVLRDKQRSDGRWLLDRIHPDEGGVNGSQGNARKVKPLALERAGEPSLWITLTALRVLKRVSDAN